MTGTRTALVLALAVLAASCAASSPSVVADSTAQPRPSLDATSVSPSTPTPVPTPAPTPTVTPTAIPTRTAVPTPTPTAVPTPPVDCVSQLPLRVALGQLLLVSATPELFPSVVELNERDQVAGVVVLGSPTRADIELLTARRVGIALLLASDEEGGRVQRLRSLLGPLPAPPELVTVATEDVRATFEAYGLAMSELGIGLALAPVVDVGGGPGIEGRSFSTDPEVVTALGRAVVEGYLSAGVIPVLKHFPGHGRASADTHLALATTPALDDLRKSDLVPFVELATSGAAVMVGHLVVPGLTGDLPASLSVDAIDGLLRGEMGFDGLVIIDDLGMNAVSARWDNAEASLLALQAGADLIILSGPDQVAPVLDALEAAVSTGSLERSSVDDSVQRVLSAKALDPCASLAAQ